MNTDIAKRYPRLTKAVIDVSLSRLEHDTKMGYMSSIRHWINWNLEHQDDPFEFPIPPQKLSVWIQQRFEEAGNIKSIRSWTAAMGLLSDLAGVAKDYKLNRDYMNHIAALKKHHQEAMDPRHPFRLMHIVKYVKHMVDKKKEDPLEAASKAALATMYFCTMSRPSELVKPSGKGGKTRGLKFVNMDRKTDKQHGFPMIKLTVDLYKNQASKKIKKTIYLGTTQCNKSNGCRCKYINPFERMREMLKMRRDLAKRVKEELDRTNNTKSRKILKTQWDNLRKKPDNYLFVHTNGKPFTIKEVTQIAKDVAKINKIMDDEHYTAYSFRIGGTTRASLAGIDHTMILRYVGWTESRLADCAMRYMRYAPKELAMVPYHMIHPRKKLTEWSKTYDPWSEKLDMKYYNKQ